MHIGIHIGIGCVSSPYRVGINVLPSDESTSYHRLTNVLPLLCTTSYHRLTTQIREFSPLQWTPKRFAQVE
jgi:hypothetical protein